MNGLREHRWRRDHGSGGPDQDDEQGGGGDGRHRVEEGVQHRVAAQEPEEPGRHRDPAERDPELLDAPGVRPVAGPLHPAAGRPEATPGERHAADQSREDQEPWRGLVEQGVGAHADADEAGQHQRSRRTSLGRREVTGPTVATGVHPGRERHRPLQRVLHHRYDDPPQAAHPAPGHPAELSGGPHPAQAVGQLGQQRDRDHDRRTDLVQRGRHRLQQPLGVGERVGGADADHDGGQPHAVVQPGEHRLECHRAQQADARHPVRQRDLRQVDQDDGAVAAAQQHPEHHPDDHDHQSEDSR